MPLELSPLPAADFPGWRTGARQRIIDGNRRSGMRVGADAVAFADEFLRELLPDRVSTPAARILRIGHDQRGALGTIWLMHRGRKLFILDLDLAEPLGVPLSDELFAHLRTAAADMGLTQISVPIFPHDTIGHAFLEGRGFTAASVQMLLEPLPERAVADHVAASPMTPERFPAFVAASEAGFARDLVESGRYTAEDAAAESHRQMRLELPDGLETEGQELFTASVAGEEVGILWLGVRERDGRPHVFILDIEVAPEHRRQGYGRELMHAAEREARRLGADSIGLHVFGFNHAAIELYEKLGYRRVEENLLLDL